MKIVLDKVVVLGNVYVVYVQLQDEKDNNKVIATASFRYDGKEDVATLASEAFKNKVIAELEKQQKIEEIKATVSATLDSIDVTKIK